MFQLIIRFRLGPRLDFPLVIKTDFISAVTSATFHTHKCVSCVSCEKRPVCLPPPACHTPAAWSHRPQWERQYLSRWALSAPLMASRNTVSPPRSLWKHTHTHTLRVIHTQMPRSFCSSSAFMILWLQRFRVYQIIFFQTAKQCQNKCKVFTICNSFQPYHYRVILWMP